MMNRRSLGAFLSLVVVSAIVSAHLAHAQGPATSIEELRTYVGIGDKVEVTRQPRKENGR
jgi:hypothetical protein